MRQASITSSYVLSVRLDSHSRRSRIKLSTTGSLMIPVLHSEGNINIAVARAYRRSCIGRNGMS